MPDQRTGTIARRLDNGVAEVSNPAVKIVVGHGTANAGILESDECCTPLITGYARA